MSIFLKEKAMNSRLGVMVRLSDARGGSTPGGGRKTVSALV
jgi:hypothetical protein